MMKSITSVIIDDEIIAADNLELTLQKYCPEVINLGKAHTLLAGLDLIKKVSPQLVFLDISLSSDESGFDLLDLLPSHTFKTIFVTAYPDFSLKAIKQRAFDYLLKPIDYKELIKSIHELVRIQFQNYCHLNKSDLIPIPSSDGTHLIKPDDILYCKADGSYTYFHLANSKTFILSKSIKYAEDLLPSNCFIRIHRSYIVQISKVSKLHLQDGGYLEINNQVLPISKSYLKKVTELYS